MLTAQPLHWKKIADPVDEESSVVKAVLKALRDVACLLLCGSLFQTVEPWYATVCWPADFVLTKGIWSRWVSEAEQSCQEGTLILRTLAKYWPCQEQKRNGWNSVCSWFADGLEASEVHAAQKWKHMVKFWWPEDSLSCTVLDFLKFPRKILSVAS